VLKKSLLGAKHGRRVAIYIDDINMPTVILHSQPPIELLRLIIDRGGVYDRKELYWKKIQDTMIVACSAPPEGGRNHLT
jgi:dynein heavy chain